MAVGIVDGDAVEKLCVFASHIVIDRHHIDPFLVLLNVVGHVERRVAFGGGDDQGRGVLEDGVFEAPLSRNHRVGHVGNQIVERGHHFHGLGAGFLLAFLGFRLFHGGRCAIHNAVFAAAVGGEGGAGGGATLIAGHLLLVVAFQVLEWRQGVAFDEFHNVPAVLGEERFGELSLLHVDDGMDVFRRQLCQGGVGQHTALLGRGTVVALFCKALETYAVLQLLVDLVDVKCSLVGVFAVKPDVGHGDLPVESLHAVKQFDEVIAVLCSDRHAHFSYLEGIGCVLERIDHVEYREIPQVALVGTRRGLRVESVQYFGRDRMKVFSILNDAFA